MMFFDGEMSRVVAGYDALRDRLLLEMRLDIYQGKSTKMDYGRIKGECKRRA